MVDDPEVDPEDHAKLLRSMREMERLGAEEEIEVLLPDGMEPESPSEDRTRARCREHGREYDPTRAEGCGLCLREEAAQRKPDWKLRGALYALVAIAGLGGIALALWLVGFGRLFEPPVDKGPSAGPQSALALDPAPYRVQIEAIEAVLYKGPAAAVTESEFLERSAKDLAEDIAFEGKASLRRAAAERIASWGTAVANTEDSESGMVDLGFARTQWEALRVDVFLAADWFGKADPEPQMVAESQPTAQASPQARDADAVTALRLVAEAMHGLIAQGWKDVESFEDGSELEEGSADAIALAARWYLWTRDWNESLREIQAQMPEQPDANVEMDLIMALQDIETALRELGRLPAAPSGGGIPSLNERRRRLHLASQALEEAKASLKKL